MLQDLEKGRRTEIDAIDGQVSAAGRDLGIPTPYSDMVVAVVKAAEQFKAVIPMETGLRFFQVLDETVSGIKCPAPHSPGSWIPGREGFPDHRRCGAGHGPN